MKKWTPIFLAILSFACSNESKQQQLPVSPPIASIDIPSTAPPISICQPDMIEVAGSYCTNVQQKCLKWMEDPLINPRARCSLFDKSICIGEKLPMHFCIDREEFAQNYEGLPLSDVSWTQSKKLCEAGNKRLCKEDEWILSCEGNEMLPYTTGYERPSNICNMDISKDVVCGKDLCDRRKPIEEMKECVSPFGVHNMAGNVDEWIEVPIYNHSKVPGLTMRSGLKGGHWLPVRNRCRPITKDHDEYYHQISIGFRCCSDIK